MDTIHAMAAPESDPRIFFAAERTLLAWLRTAIAVIGVGFVVSRFGLVLQMFSSHVATAKSSLAAAILGVAFVVAGSVVSLAAVVQHRRFVMSLPEKDLPRGYSDVLAVWFSLFIACLGFLLAGYLAMTHS